jgi:hypothetical protein
MCYFFSNQQTFLLFVLMRFNNICFLEVINLTSRRIWKSTAQPDPGAHVPA